MRFWIGEEGSYFGIEEIDGLEATKADLLENYILYVFFLSYFEIEQVIFLMWKGKHITYSLKN